jgi:hypothetical protein
MNLTFHPAAEAAFNEKATGLVQLVVELPESSPSHSFPTQRHIAAHFTDKDFLGEAQVSWSDYQGNSVGRMFLHGNKPYGLKGDSYKPLSKLAQSIRNIPWAAEVLSQQFVEECLFDWVEGRYKGVSSEPFCAYLVGRSEMAVVEGTSWIPIANLEIESPFPVITSEVRPIDKATIGRWIDSVKGPPEELEERRSKVGERLRKYQGLAAVVTTVKAEPRQAAVLAVEHANRVVSVLSLFSAGMLFPDIKSLSKLKGCETLAQVTRITPPEAGGLLMAESIVDRASAQFWRLSNNEIHLIRKAGLDAISSLLSLAEPNDFQEAVINALSIHSKAAFSADPVEKLVFVLSSLESLLLKSDTESIQQNLSERLALISGRDLDKRKKIVTNVKEVYGIRSRYLHHGRPPSEIEAIREFLLVVWGFYTSLVMNVNTFKTKADFITWIDDVKLSGPG